MRFCDHLDKNTVHLLFDTKQTGSFCLKKRRRNGTYLIPSPTTTRELF